MLSRITARRKPAALRRKLLGLLTLLWLNMAAMPCAMAFESGEICPHCPPADEHAMASHHGHGEIEAEPSCATAQSECCDLDEASIDSRGGKLELKPAPEVLFVSGPPTASVPLRPSAQRYSASDPPGTPGAWPPLHVLYCVYLD